MRKRRAAGDMWPWTWAPTGKILKPMGDLDFEDACALFGEVAETGTRAGADCILIETMSDGYEVKAAVLGAKEHSPSAGVCHHDLRREGKTPHRRQRRLGGGPSGGPGGGCPGDQLRAGACADEGDCGTDSGGGLHPRPGKAQRRPAQERERADGLRHRCGRLRPGDGGDGLHGRVDDGRLLRHHPGAHPEDGGALPCHCAEAH